MGLFSTKKTVVVSSSAWNLAGDENERMNYLKTVIAGSVINNNKTSISDEITNSYLGGPGIKLRSFGRWARTSNYSNLVGQSPGTFILPNAVDRAALIAAIPKASDQFVQLQTAEIGVADYTYWVDQFLLTSFPDQIGTNYEVNFDVGTNLISIIFENASVASFSPVGFNRTGTYIYANYSLYRGEELGTLVEGDEIAVDSEEDFPETDDYTLTESDVVSQSLNLVTKTTVVVSYSDATPGSTTVTEDTGTAYYEDYEQVWEATSYQGINPSTAEMTSLRFYLHLGQLGEKTTTTETTTTTEVTGGVTKTTTTTVETDTLNMLWAYRIDEQLVIHQSWEPSQILIYEKDTGNSALDALFQASASAGDFLPYIPVRVADKFVSDTFLENIYPQAQKALKKAVGGDFDEVVEKVADNDNLADIDFAYIVFGVSLNVKENACKRYIYEFFQEFTLGQDLSGAEYDAWYSSWLAQNDIALAWKAWFQAQSDNLNPLYGTPQPPTPNYPAPPSYSVRVASDNLAGMNYDMTVSWNGIRETVGSGLKKPDAKVGEIWLESVGQTNFVLTLINPADDEDIVYEEAGIGKIYINWQVTANNWRRLEIDGLTHRNMVFEGNSVNINAHEALLDEDETGFIVPLHEDIFKRMSLVQATQMSTACTFIVFNSFKIYKQKWYQTEFFRILLIIVVIAVSFWIGGAGGLGIGLLGSNASVGAALGFTGLAATIAGSVANGIAAMILTKIITTASTALFGDKIGAIIGLFASFIAVNLGTAFMSGLSLSTGFTLMMSPENLLKLSVAAGNGYAEILRADTLEIAQRTQGVLQDYARQSADLSKQYDEMFGQASRGVIDPLATTDAFNRNFYESRDSFLARTLLTGSDIAETTIQMLSGFADITLSTKLPE